MIGSNKHKSRLERKNLFRKDLYDVYKFPKDYINGVIDIGAELGYFSIMMAILQPYAAIIAIENSNLFEVLQLNIVGFSSIITDNTIFSCKKEGDLLSIYNKYLHDRSNIFVRLNAKGKEKYIFNERSEYVINKSCQTMISVNKKEKNIDDYMIWASSKFKNHKCCIHKNSKNVAIIKIISMEALKYFG